MKASRRDAKIHGDIPGYPPGSRFKSRSECSEVGVHAPTRAGIHGNVKDGAFSIVLSFGYEDDQDHGETCVYTGEGGRDKQVSKLQKMMGKKRWGGRQKADQEWTRGNYALQISSITKKPIRVIRGANKNLGSGSKYAPAHGYRYDGLYIVEEAWKAAGRTGFQTCRFRLRRVPGQPPLPGDVAQSSRTQSEHLNLNTRGTKVHFKSFTGNINQTSTAPVRSHNGFFSGSRFASRKAQPEAGCSDRQQPFQELPPIATLQVDTCSHSSESSQDGGTSSKVRMLKSPGKYVDHPSLPQVMIRNPVAKSTETPIPLSRAPSRREKSQSSVLHKKRGFELSSESFPPIPKKRIREVIDLTNEPEEIKSVANVEVKSVSESLR